jgi:tetratricopeptide (TPR) repeat protein
LRNWIKEAEADFAQCIQLDPNYPLAYDNRARMYLNHNRPDPAIADLTTLIGLAERTLQRQQGGLTRGGRGLARAHANRAAGYIMKEIWEKAIADCVRALEIDPTYQHPHLLLDRARTGAKSAADGPR